MKWVIMCSTVLILMASFASASNCDFNANGITDAHDLSDFVVKWANESSDGCLKCTTDFDGNGHIEPADISAFINEWWPIATTPPKPVHSNPRSIKMEAEISTIDVQGDISTVNPQASILTETESKSVCDNSDNLAAE